MMSCLFVCCCHLCEFRLHPSKGGNPGGMAMLCRSVRDKRAVEYAQVGVMV
jgi:hypothetical protein